MSVQDPGMKHAEARQPPHPKPETASGIPLPEFIAPDGTEVPGEFPFTRGIFKNGYRGRLWTFRQYSGFGSAEETNERYKFLLARRLDRVVRRARSANAVRLRSR